ncbi:hypothetical protein [Oscillibacter sp.]|uniref:hypothetical protein n=1 Tax=Oscillibacter sp. TaxID=1945593 RepID=UPI003397023C
MKVGEAIAKIQKLKPDIYGDEILTSWLSELDGKYSVELLKGEEPVSYEYPRDAETELLVLAPYTNVYELYLIAMIDWHNREMQSYENDKIMFAEADAEFRSWYRRTHRPANTAGWTTF